MIVDMYIKLKVNVFACSCSKDEGNQKKFLKLCLVSYRNSSGLGHHYCSQGCIYLRDPPAYFACFLRSRAKTWTRNGRHGSFLATNLQQDR